MPITDLIPWKRKEPVPVEEERGLQVRPDPLLGLQQQMNRMFDDLFGGSAPRPFALEEGQEFSPRVDVAETGKVIRVSAELPGLEESDIEVKLSRDELTISGEKRQEKDEKGHNYVRVERSYGFFRRSVPLSCEVDASKVDAAFRNGVLTVTLPKTAKGQDRKKIAIKVR
jgi:HSP20 family protein